MASCENKVDNVATVNFPISKEESVSLKLKSHVTSGIADSQGRSKKLLNEKETILNVPPFKWKSHPQIVAPN